jgi:hypothetical protein
MRGQRDKHAAETAQAAGKAVAVIDVLAHKPRPIPSAQWRELIKKVWEADPLLCPRCSREMKIGALIDDREVIQCTRQTPSLRAVRGMPRTARSVSPSILPSHAPSGSVATMKSRIQAGNEGRVPAPPEKRFPIHGTPLDAGKA